MVLCKFFLQGNCRFGDSCKFEHGNHGSQQHASVLRQGNFHPNQNVLGNSNSNIDTNTLIRAVINDTVSAEKGGQWLLSCYAPFKEKPNFPGFEEESFEEIRWGFYEAQTMGTINQYVQQLQMSLQAAVLKLRALQNPSQDAIKTITNIYNTPTGISQNVFGNATNSYNQQNNSGFINSNTNNVFGRPNNYGTTNVFAQNNEQQNSVTAAKSIFATANQKLFGDNQPQQQHSIFSNNQLSNNYTNSNLFNQPFGIQNQGVNNAQQTSPFEQQSGGFALQQQPQQMGVFAPQQQQPFSSQPIFPSTTSPFVQNSGFGIQPQPQGTSPLLGVVTNQQQNTSPFGVQQQPNNAVFASPQQLQQPSTTIPFATQPINTQSNNSANIFQAAPLQAENAISSNGSFFGSTQNTVNPAGMANIDPNCYSKLEDLSESDIKSYESDHFEFGNIPEKPPTIQMCL